MASLIFVSPNMIHTQAMLIVVFYLEMKDASFKKRIDFLFVQVIIFEYLMLISKAERKD